VGSLQNCRGVARMVEVVGVGAHWYRGLLVIRGCFVEMQSRERGAVMVVAGCTEKTTPC